LFCGRRLPILLIKITGSSHAGLLKKESCTFKLIFLTKYCYVNSKSEVYCHGNEISVYYVSSLQSGQRRRVMPAEVSTPDFQRNKSSTYISMFIPLQLHLQIAIWHLTLCLGVLEEG
jgi:hypothetical protein